MGTRDVEIPAGTRVEVSVFSGVVSLRDGICEIGEMLSISTDVSFFVVESLAKPGGVVVGDRMFGTTGPVVIELC